jgi:heme A synthase
MITFRKAYSAVGVLLILEYLAQFYLIATAIFTSGGAFDPYSEPKASSQAIYASFKDADPIAQLHVFNGYFVIPITTLVLIGLSFAARHPRKTTGLTALLAVLLLLQMSLVWLAIPMVTALHALNAVVLVALAGWLTWTNWAWRTPREPAKQVEAIPVATTP